MKMNGGNCENLAGCHLGVFHCVTKGTQEDCAWPSSAEWAHNATHGRRQQIEAGAFGVNTQVNAYINISTTEYKHQFEDLIYMHSCPYL